MTAPLRQYLATLSPAAKIGAALGAIALVLLAFKFGDWKDDGELDALKAEKQQLTESYNQAIGVAQAEKERGNREAAEGAEYKMQAEALEQEIARSKGSVKAIDDRIVAITEKHEKDKQNLNCSDPPDCARKLCLELRAAGYAVSCPD